MKNKLIAAIYWIVITAGAMALIVFVTLGILGGLAFWMWVHSWGM